MYHTSMYFKVTNTWIFGSLKVHYVGEVCLVKSLFLSLTSRINWCCTSYLRCFNYLFDTLIWTGLFRGQFFKRFCTKISLILSSPRTVSNTPVNHLSFSRNLQHRNKAEGNRIQWWRRKKSVRNNIQSVCLYIHTYIHYIPLCAFIMSI